ncbi:MAG: helix-turn-helix transcriptional regulator [Bacteroidales bacterium]|nr:helix-turn-helix transcriptional regulator [Bacteroidales bacterium]
MGGGFQIPEGVGNPIFTESYEKFREEAFSFYFGEIIRNRRKELKLSQNDLAELFGKKRPYISRIENGEDIRLSNFY